MPRRERREIVLETRKIEFSVRSYIRGAAGGENRLSLNCIRYRIKLLKRRVLERNGRIRKRGNVRRGGERKTA